MSFAITANYQQWRDRIFTVQPEHVSLAQPKPNDIYGVIIDIGMIDTRDATQWAISISAFSSGEASFQPTPGGGIIGLGGDNRVAQTAQEVVEIAQPLFPQTQPADDLNLPEPGTVQFFFLTPSGIRVLRGALNDFEKFKHPYKPLLEKFRFIHYLAHQISRGNPIPSRRQSPPQNPPAAAKSEITETSDSSSARPQAPIANPHSTSASPPSHTSSPASSNPDPDLASASQAGSPETTQLQLQLEMSPPGADEIPTRQVNPALKWLHILVYMCAISSYLSLVFGIFNLPILLNYLDSIEIPEVLLQQGDYSYGDGLRYQALKIGGLLLPPILLALPNLWQIAAAIVSRRQNPGLQVFSKTSGFHLITNVGIMASLSWFFLWILGSGIPDPERLEAILEDAKYYWLAAIAVSMLVTVTSERLAALGKATSVQTIIDKVNFLRSRDDVLRPFLRCSVKAYKKGRAPSSARKQKMEISGVVVEIESPPVLVLAVDKTEKFVFRYWRNRVNLTPERPPLRELDRQHFAQVTMRHRLKVMDDETVQYIQKTWVDFTRKYTQYSPHVKFSKQTDCEYHRENKTVMALQNSDHTPSLLSPILHVLLGVTPFSLAHSLWLDRMTRNYTLEVVTEYSHASPIETLGKRAQS